MSWFPGQLIPFFQVKCGMCKALTITGIADAASEVAHTREEAGKALQSRGWERTRAWGWICSSCARFGSAGVIPSPKGMAPAEAFEQGRKILEERKK
jgi:hypothetical protein